MPLTSVSLQTEHCPHRLAFHAGVASFCCRSFAPAPPGIGASRYQRLHALMQVDCRSQLEQSNAARGMTHHLSPAMTGRPAWFESGWSERVPR